MFEQWYNAHTQGHGIWKWNNALAAYDRHFGAFVGHTVVLAEVGVQSGGSIDMWHAVFGPNCTVHGLDINEQVRSFVGAGTSITVGDQADKNMWNQFYIQAKSVDILIDDGGHHPYQMLVTLEQGMAYMPPGGFVVIEDIHGQQYLDSFFKPASAQIAAKAVAGQVSGVHVYPYLLVVQAGGVSASVNQTNELTFVGTPVNVQSFADMWVAIDNIRASQPELGGHIVLENAGWGPFLTTQGILSLIHI